MVTFHTHSGPEGRMRRVQQGHDPFDDYLHNLLFRRRVGVRLALASANDLRLDRCSLHQNEIC
jgi:hypothetical protein